MIKRVVVGVSGGVDSAVSALLLKKKGFDVCGVFMTNWDTSDEFGTCSHQKDREDAEFVCHKLKIPFREVSFIKEYWNEVFTYMLDSYQEGLTPNPDIVCNKKIKFDLFFKHATDKLGADALATGHYARTSFGCYLEKFRPSTDVSLLRAVDRRKDQSFFLSQVRQEPLRRTMFPVGDLIKKDVKGIAIENGLERIAKRRESMGMCFIGQRNFQKFISEYLPPKPGKFVDVMTGLAAGDHDGAHFWVSGQRVHIGGMDKARYVIRKCSESDILIGPGTDHPAQFSHYFTTGKPHWIMNAPDFGSTNLSFDCEFLFQHVEIPVKCRLISLSSGGLFVALQKPVKHMNPGQFSVFYDGENCLGSAEIRDVGPTFYALGKSIPDNFREYYDHREVLDIF